MFMQGTSGPSDSSQTWKFNRQKNPPAIWLHLWSQHWCVIWIVLLSACNLPDLSANPCLSLFNSGAILAFMLGIFQIPLEECEQMYRKLGADVFKQNVIVGTVKMGWSHAFYDSEIWENILKLVHITPLFFRFIYFFITLISPGPRLTLSMFVPFVGNGWVRVAWLKVQGTRTPQKYVKKKKNIILSLFAWLW